MAPPYENQSPPSAFNLELSGDRGDHHQYHHLFNLEEPHDHQTSFSSSSLSSPMFFTPPPDHDQPQPPSQYREPQKFQFQLLEGDKIGSYGGSCDDHQTLESEGGGNGSTVLKLSISKNGAPRNCGDAMNNSSSVKWMSSKMRIMRKMANPDQSSSSCPTTTSGDEKPISMSHKMSSSSKNTNTAPIIRVCSDCNTTKTPLWRSGPRGPKSLCNACGIRQRKARRAMAAAAAVANGTSLVTAAAAGGAPSMKITSTAHKGVQHKENKSRSVGSSTTVPFKKRPYKLTSSSTSPSPRGNKSANKKLCTFEDFAITMNTNNSSGGGESGTTTTTTSTTTTTTAALHQRVFPQDEKEAAILLMALSCGLVHG